MSKAACAAKEILCTGKAITDLQSSIDQLEFIRNRSVNNFGILEEEESIKNTETAEEVIRLNKKITKLLMGE